MGLFSIIGSLFTSNNSNKVVDSITTGLDTLVYTDQEKANMKLEMLKHYEPFKIAQRLIATIFTVTFCIAFLTGLIVLLLGKDTSPILNYVQAFGLDKIMLSIIIFYFAGGTLNTFVSKK